jgi:hypothetical protein
MLIFKYIPNILKDEGRAEKHLPFVLNQTLQEYLNELDFYSPDNRIIVMGKVVTDLSIILKDGDEIIITPAVKWDWIVWIGGAIYAIYMAVQPYLWILYVLSIAYSIYSIFQSPRTPSFGNGEGLDEGSPTYGWDGISNTQDVGVPIGVVYGEHRVGGNIINQFIRTDGDKEYLNLLISLSEGEIESINDIEINENALAVLL